jgi:hypothetical protein
MFLVGKIEGKRPIARHRHRWEDNIKMNHRVSGWSVVDWIHLVLVKTLMDFTVP